MKKANFTIQQLLVATALLLCTGSMMAQVTIQRTWNNSIFNNEVGWEIINQATNTTVDCEAVDGANAVGGTITLSVPAGNYEVRGYDSFGDGWDNGSLSVSQGGVTLCNADFFGFGINTCPGNSGGQVLCTFAVAAPCTVICPGNLSVNNTPGHCGAVVNFTIDDSSCSTPATVTPPSGSEFPPGITKVTATSGVASCSFFITVTDTEPPTITCPGDKVFTLAPGECSKIVDYNVGFADNCPLVSPILYTQNPPGLNPNQPIVAGQSLNCGFNQTKFGRVFGGPNQPAFSMTGVQCGISTLQNGQPGLYTYSVYQLTSGTAPAAGNANMLLLGGPFNVNMPNNTPLQYVPVTFPAPVDVPAGSYFFVEIIDQDGNYTMGNIQATDLPGTPSYIASAACGLPNYGTFASVGFSYLSLAFNVVGNISAPPPIQTEGFASGSAFPIGTTHNCFYMEDAHGLPATCCFNVTVKEYPNPTLALACNDNVQISLDENCEALIGADMILEGGPYGCYDTRYTVMVLSPVGQNLGNTVNSSFIGTTWTVKVVDNVTGNSCWGSINVEDKLKPVITCKNLNVPCNADITPVDPAVAPIDEISKEFSKSAGLPILDLQTTTSTMDIDGGDPGTILDVDLVVNITHTWIGDMTITLESPAGTKVAVWATNGCANDNMAVDWDDEAACTNLCANFTSGTWQSLACTGFAGTQFLSDFDGESVNGTWTLTVSDAFGGDQGTLNSWAIQVTYLGQTGALGPEYSDNCGPLTLHYVDSFTGGNCGGPSGKVVRTWTVTDPSGNTASCNQTITYTRPNLDDVVIPGDILWTCDQYNAFPNITAPEHLHPYITDTDPGTFVIDVNLDPNCDDDDQVLGNGTKDWPGVNSTNVANGGNGCPGGVLSFVPAPNSGLDDADVLALTGSGEPTVDGKPLAYICGIEVAHTDLYIVDCPGTFKILRKWTVIDWCANPVDVREINQVIKVADKVGPTINAPTDLTISVYSASFPQGGGPNSVCQGTFVVAAASGITDNCSGVVSYATELWTLTGQLLKSIPNNGGVFSGIPMFVNGLPAQYIVRYYATDGCGNQGTDDTKITLVDKVPPVAICDEITEVSVTNNGPGTGQSCSTLSAASLDDGSYDNCKPVYFLIAKMDDSFSPNIFNRCYYPTRNFCCDDLGGQTVIVLVLDGNPAPYMTTLNSPSLGCDGTPGLFLSTGFSALNYNTCMVTVQVTDKLPPILTGCPQNQRRTCDYYASNLETHLTGLSSAQQCALLTQAGFGEATFYDNCSLNVTCSVNKNIDQCLEGTITRTWSAQDNAGNNGLQSCTQTIFIDQVSDWVVEFPADITVNCGNDVPDFGEPKIFFETCELVAVSYTDQVFTVVPDACYKISRKWTVINWCVIGSSIDQEVVETPENALGLPFPACDLDGDGDCDNRTFRDSWNAASKPTAANATQTTNPDIDLDSDPWDGYITYQQIIKVIDNAKPVFTDGCAIPDVCISNNTCGATVLLPTPAVDECSTNVTISATGQLGIGFGPFSNVAPGTYNVSYNAMDNCNNQTVCNTTLKVKDCKKPVPYCKNGLVIELDPPADTIQVTVHAADFNFASFDNCPGNLIFSFSSDINDKQITYYCSDIGQQPVQMWVTDVAGNQDYCETFIIVQANLGQCNNDPLVAGAIATAANHGVQNVNVSINGGSGSIQQNIMTDATGHYSFANVPAGGDYTISPALDVNPLNGVSTYDLVLISKHILGEQPLDSPYKIIAADANKSNSVTTFDLVEIRKLILFINTEFPNNTSWRFIKKSYVFPNPANPFQPYFPEVANINNLAADQLAVDFVAVKTGDVNGSAVTNLLGGNDDRTTMGGLVFNADDMNMEAGEFYTVAFKATDFNVSGFQFTLNFDKNALEIADVVSGLAEVSNFGLTMADQGVITASWNSDEAKQLAPGDMVFGLTFKAKRDALLSTALSINSRFTVAEAYGANAELLNVALSFNNTMVADGFALYQNTPNPFANTTAIGFYLPEATSATLAISDVQGKVVKVIQGDFAKGFNQIDLRRSELGATGVLYYRLETATDSAIRKMILVD